MTYIHAEYCCGGGGGYESQLRKQASNAFMILTSIAPEIQFKVKPCVRVFPYLADLRLELLSVCNYIKCLQCSVQRHKIFVPRLAVLMLHQCMGTYAVRVSMNAFGYVGAASAHSSFA